MSKWWGDNEASASSHIGRTPGQAKYEWYLELDGGLAFWEVVPHLKTKKLGNLHPSHFFNRKGFDFEDLKVRRNIPFATLGMRIMVGDLKDWIIGANSYANLDVLGNDGQFHNVHPHWNIRYFSPEGKV
ncbi:MAG: hypothetical protein GTO45_22295, partial [Candidatus Aminicenantes bacterium]|nr:hypothetical protein [Candidatus Aminicenantes bacterium]NIM84086.1 hypothetical protein [Candidatus Aminicenantes bacterium]NIN20866.1 hypothetical protein [Candidatus Aminicenantes bacterium]NIN44687.1 hypothetical protein [Candidatus Aminicenantes bacterium]NIN87495.1 hypothetical protein [Candidatus Aminicenantes bacterium]